MMIFPEPTKLFRSMLMLRHSLAAGTKGVVANPGLVLISVPHFFHTEVKLFPQSVETRTSIVSTLLRSNDAAAIQKLRLKESRPKVLRTGVLKSEFLTGWFWSK